MSIDWTTVITALIGALFGGSIGTLFLIRYNRQKAKTEARSASNKEQEERIDLGDKYVTHMLDMMQKIYATTSLTESSNKDLLSRMEDLGKGLKEVKDEVSSIVTYLNGPYQAFKNEETATEEK